MAAEKITLRSICYEDYDILYEIMKKAMSELGSKENKNNDEENDEWFKKGHEEFFEKDFNVDHRPFIVQYDGKDIGRLRVLRREKEIYIAGIQIVPEYQNKGIGRELIKTLTEESESKCIPITLHVSKINNKAYRFYERQGFEKKGEGNDEDYFMKKENINTS